MKYFTLIIIAAFFVTACHKSNGDEQQNDEPSETEGIYDLEGARKQSAISFGPLQQRSVARNVSCTGSIEIPQTNIWSVHALHAGYIRSLNFLPGDKVNRGAHLFSIEQPGLVEMQRLLLETKADLSLAQSNYERKALLKSESAVSTSDYEEALARKDLLKARYEGLSKELGSLGIHVESLLNEHAFQTSTTIYAPAGGKVHQVMVNRGKMVNPGDELMTIADDSRLQLQLQVLSRDISLIKPGQQVEFSVPGSKEVFTAEVDKINPMMQNSTATLQVHCELNRSDIPRLKAGLYANATIQVEQAEVSGLPEDAVIRQGKDYFAYAVDGDQLVKTILSNVVIYDGFISFDELDYPEFVIAGGYYLE